MSVTVAEMRIALRKMPDNAPLFVDVQAYYHQGERQDENAIELPTLVGGKVCIGSVYAQP